jgi:hypothetical protein
MTTEKVLVNASGITGGQTLSKKKCRNCNMYRYSYLKWLRKKANYAQAEFKMTFHLG